MCETEWERKTAAIDEMKIISIFPASINFDLWHMTNLVNMQQSIWECLHTILKNWKDTMHDWEILTHMADISSNTIIIFVKWARKNVSLKLNLLTEVDFFDAHCKYRKTQLPIDSQFCYSFVKRSNWSDSIHTCICICGEGIAANIICWIIDQLIFVWAIEW